MASHARYDRGRRQFWSVPFRPHSFCYHRCGAAIRHRCEKGRFQRTTMTMKIPISVGNVLWMVAIHLDCSSSRFGRPLGVIRVDSTEPAVGPVCLRLPTHPWAKTRHSLDLPKPRQSTPCRSATNGEDDPRRNRWAPHGEWTDAQPILSMSIGGPCSAWPLGHNRTGQLCRPGYREHSPARVLADGSCLEDSLKPCAD